MFDQRSRVRRLRAALEANKIFIEVVMGLAIATATIVLTVQANSILERQVAINTQQVDLAWRNTIPELNVTLHRCEKIYPGCLRLDIANKGGPAYEFDGDIRTYNAGYFLRECRNFPQRYYQEISGAFLGPRSLFGLGDSDWSKFPVANTLATWEAGAHLSPYVQMRAALRNYLIDTPKACGTVTFLALITTRYVDFAGRRYTSTYTVGNTDPWSAKFGPPFAEMDAAIILSQLSDQLRADLLLDIERGRTWDLIVPSDIVYPHLKLR